jgi:hypothetical protein
MRGRNGIESIELAYWSIDKSMEVDLLVKYNKEEGY